MPQVNVSFDEDVYSRVKEAAGQKSVGVNDMIRVCVSGAFPEMQKVKIYEPGKSCFEVDASVCKASTHYDKFTYGHFLISPEDARKLRLSGEDANLPFVSMTEHPIRRLVMDCSNKSHMIQPLGFSMGEFGDKMKISFVAVSC